MTIWTVVSLPMWALAAFSVYRALIAIVAYFKALWTPTISVADRSKRQEAIHDAGLGFFTACGFCTLFAYIAARIML